MVQPTQYHTVVDHLSELRTRMGVCIACAVLCAGVAFCFYEVLFHLLVLPSRGSIDTFYVYSPETAFVVRIKTALIVGGMCAVPVMIYHACAFMRPGLTPKERRVLVGGVCSMVIASGVGLVFSYYCLVPVAIRFLMAYSNGIAQPIIGLDAYMRFILGLLCASAMLFLAPPIMVMCDHLGIVSCRVYEKQRGIVAVVIVVCAAIVTPPDVVTQCMIAMPLYGLFEITVLGMKLARWKNDKKATEFSGEV